MAVPSFKRHGDLVAPVDDVGELGVEAVVGVRLRVFDQDPRELAPQDLEFRCRTVEFAGRRHGEGRGRSPVFAEESHADFAGVGRADVLLDAHAAGNLASGAADVDVLPLVPTLRESLDDGGPPTSGGELMSERRPGDACSRDDDVASHVSTSDLRLTEGTSSNLVKKSK